jgi:diguanylate cyclase (GGDEF)-like protein/PAS domain S-box-containing protein
MTPSSGSETSDYQEALAALEARNRDLEAELARRLAVESELREQVDLYQALLRAQSEVGEGVIVIEQGRIIYANEAITTLTGYSTSEVLALPSFMTLVHPDDAPWVAENHRRRLAGEKFENRYETAMLTKSGQRVEIEIAIASFPYQGHLRIVVVVLDITARKQVEEQVRYMALHDSLTGLPNRALLGERLRQLVAESRRSGEKVAVLMVDLDEFKLINDSFGHELGDEVLRIVSQRLAGCVREMDTVARVGGDEFVILLGQLNSPQGAARIAQSIIEEMNQPIRIQSTDYFVGASIGIALCPDDADEPDMLLRNADKAMYEAKADGKNIYHLCKGG